ncbi:MAG TPA: MarR family transcriptional regulator [Symbiobacteriaceae bacterium]|nr:MarR family transcriptional regulator [Symbiobacteriaceae bacterium]
MADLHNNVGKYLSVATRHMQAAMARRMEHLGIGAGQYPYLFSLYHEDGQTQQHLADRLLVDKSAAVGAINRLEGLGYVERRTDAADRRHYRIHLTDRGREIRPELERIVEEVLAQALDGMDNRERDALLAALRKVVEHMTAK